MFLYPVRHWLTAPTGAKQWLDLANCSCLQCMAVQLSRKLAFIAFFHLYSCFTFAVYLCTSLKLQWSILDNRTDRSQSLQLNCHTIKQCPLLQFITLFTTDHHRIIQWGNMNWHCRYFKIRINFTLKSLPQSPKQYCSFRCPAHNIMLFSFSHTLNIHQYKAAWLYCCFHLILEE